MKKILAFNIFFGWHFRFIKMRRIFFSTLKISFIKNSKRSASYRTLEVNSLLKRKKFLLSSKKRRKIEFCSKIGFIKLFTDISKRFSLLFCCAVAKRLFIPSHRSANKSNFLFHCLLLRSFALCVGEIHALLSKLLFLLCSLDEEVASDEKAFLWCKSSFQM